MSLILLGILNSQAAAAGGAGAYDLLDSTTLSSSASDISFTGLDTLAADYTHLQIRGLLKNTTDLNGLNNWELEFNNYTTNRYHSSYLFTNGSVVTDGNRNTVDSLYFSNGLVRSAAAEASIYGSFVLDIMNFADATQGTSVRGLLGAVATTEDMLQVHGGYLDNNQAITSIKIRSVIDLLASGSRVSLYGIKGA